MTDTLERLLASAELTLFADTTFGRKPLHVTGARDGYPEVMSLSDMEELLLTLTSPTDTAWLRLVRKGTTLPVVSHMLDARGQLNTSVAFERFSRGYSIVLNQVHRRSIPVRRLCRSLEEDLISLMGIRMASEVFANAYLSPAGHQAFNPHTDSEHVFVLQLSGRKRWGLWPQVAPAPVSSQERLRVDPNAPEESIVLEAGDLLYLPGGTPHAAHTLPDEHSLHLSVGVRPVTQATVLRSAIIASETLGATLSPRSDEVGLDLEAPEAEMLAVRSHRNTLIASPAEPGVLERLVRPITDGDRVMLRSGSPEDVVDGPHGVVVVAHGCRRQFGGEGGEAIRRLLEQREMEVGEQLPAELATALIACGMAEKA